MLHVLDELALNVVKINCVFVQARTKTQEDTSVRALGSDFSDEHLLLPSFRACCDPCIFSFLVLLCSVEDYIYHANSECLMMNNWMSSLP